MEEQQHAFGESHAIEARRVSEKCMLIRHLCEQVVHAESGEYDGADLPLDARFYVACFVILRAMVYDAAIGKRRYHAISSEYVDHMSAVIDVLCKTNDIPCPPCEVTTCVHMAVEWTHASKIPSRVIHPDQLDMLRSIISNMGMEPLFGAFRRSVQSAS